MEKDNTETRTREIVTDVLAAQPCRLSVPLRTQVKLSMTTATCRTRRWRQSCPWSLPASLLGLIREPQVPVRDIVSKNKVEARWWWQGMSLIPAHERRSR